MRRLSANRQVASEATIPQLSFDFDRRADVLVQEPASARKFAPPMQVQTRVKSPTRAARVPQFPEQAPQSASVPIEPPRRLLYNIKEAAQCLGVKRATMYKYIDRGDLERVKIGARALISVESIERFIVLARERQLTP